MRSEANRISLLEEDVESITRSLRSIYCLIDGLSKNMQLLTTELEETQRKLDEQSSNTNRRN